MSRSGRGSAAAKQVVVDSEYEEVPTYVLGQVVPGFGRGSARASEEEICCASAYQPFVVKQKQYRVGIVGAVNMMLPSVKEDGIENVFMIMGPEEVAKVDPSCIFSVKCDLAYPEGYGGHPGKCFDIEAIMRRHWASLP
jgi:hypothetical protein